MINIWNPNGEIIEQFNSIDDADDFLEDNELARLATTYNDGDVNIVVLELP